MAYTSVIPVHRLDRSVDYVLNKEKTSRSKNAASLEDAVDYALNRDKTERDLFESALGCTCATAFEDIRRVKQAWHKTGGVQGFHLVQSFAPGEITPELAHRIGLEFADKLLGGRYQAIIGTHLNTQCVHNHIVWNSVALDNGRKYRSNYKSYITEVRAVSDELCIKYGLSVIHTAQSEKVSQPYALWMAERDGRPTWKTAIRQDIDDAIASAFTWRQFLSLLERRGYTFRLDRKYITLRPPGKERNVRFKTLGPRYTPEAIQRRILAPKRSPPAGKKVQRGNLRTSGKPVRKITGLRALYFVYLYRMGVLPRKPHYPCYEVREDIRRLDKRLEQMRFLNEHHIDDRQQLSVVRTKAESEIAALTKERQRLYRNEPDSERVWQIKTRLKQLRRTARFCRDITIQSEEMERRMQMDRRTAQRLREEKEHTASRKNRESAR